MMAALEVSERHFNSVLEARNAMGSALHHLANMAEAMARQGDESVPPGLRQVSEGDLAAAVGEARRLVDKYGEHAGFVIG